MRARRLIDALLPDGALWAPEEGRELDDLLDGIAQCIEPVREDLLDLAYVRDPLRTPMLPDLEREFGMLPTSAMSEESRRSRLAGVKSSRSGDGSIGHLQAALIAAGFSVKVYANSPAVDPALFVYYAPSTVCGNTAARVGAASVGGQRGGILVNSGEDSVAAFGVIPPPGQYAVPTDPGYWPLFFFVGGEVTYDGDWRIASIEDAPVPAERRAELITLILRCKPLHSWAAMRVQYV